MGRMKCPSCGTDLIWGCEHVDDECANGSVGVITQLDCLEPDCPVDLVVAYQSWPEERGRWEGGAQTWASSAISKEVH